MNNSKCIAMEGIITEIKDGAVRMDLKGRLGDLTVPKRMLISENKLHIGQEVSFEMSFPEVIKKETTKKEKYKMYNL